MRIILLGAPGSGKGTLGEMIARAYGFPRISTGDLLRQAVREGTPLGRQAEGIMAQGGLVPDEIVTAIVRERIARPDCRAGYILDGYPRTIAQAESLARIDTARRELVISFEVGLSSLIERLCGRRVCPSCGAIYHLTRKPSLRPGLCDSCGAGLQARTDDAVEVVRERIQIYESATAPLKAFYKERSDFRPLDGEGTAAEVFPRIAAVLDEALRPDQGGAAR
jgi:adenylate kinase